MPNNENLIVDNKNNVFYVIKINGVEVSARFTKAIVAEMTKNSLPQEQQLLAEIVTITEDGNQILFG